MGCRKAIWETNAQKLCNFVKESRLKLCQVNSIHYNECFSNGCRTADNHLLISTLITQRSKSVEWHVQSALPLLTVDIRVSVTSAGDQSMEQIVDLCRWY